MAARPALIRDLVCYLRSRASPWSAYFHFKNLCAQRLTTGGHYLVLRGPFAGMAIGRQGSGMQLPMLVGSYEMEIWPFLESMERAGIRRSIHLGAANGYFAVGFAWKFHHEVTAFESRQDDRDTCLQPPGKTRCRTGSISGQPAAGKICGRKSSARIP